MGYPYGEIKQIYNKAKLRGYRLSGMSKDMLKLFKFKEQDIPYRDVPIENFGKRVKFGSGKEQKDKNFLINETVKNLATVYATKTVEFMFRDVYAWQQENKPDSLKRTQLNHAFLRRMVSPHRGHWANGQQLYMATLYGHIVLGKCDGMILPDLITEDYDDISRMAFALAETIGMDDTFLYQIKDIEETGVVKNMCIDYVVGDTLYLVRCGRTYTRDIIHLLMCYILMKKSPKYKDIPVKHLCMVGTAYGHRRYVDIDNVDPIVFVIIHYCMFGTGEGWALPPIV